MNEKQRPYVFGGVTCGVIVAALIGFFPNAINTNPILQAVAFVLAIPASIVSCWLLTHVFKSSSGR